MHICKPGTWEEVGILVSLSEILSQKNQTKLKIETKLPENEQPTFRPKNVSFISENSI